LDFIVLLWLLAGLLFGCVIVGVWQRFIVGVVVVVAGVFYGGDQKQGNQQKGPNAGCLALSLFGVGVFVCFRKPKQAIRDKRIEKR